MSAVYDQLGREFGARLLLRDMALEVVLPVDMSYIAGSADPQADWDARSRTLRWTFRNVGFAGWEGAFSVRPGQPGHRPTIARAEADVVDGFGNRFPVSFPVPWVEVLDPPTPTVTVTPTASPTDTPTAMSTPSPLYLPVALHERCDPVLERADIALVLDTSSSMTGKKLEDAKAAALTFVEQMDLSPGRSQVAVVRFDREAEVMRELTNAHALIEAAISNLEVRSGTHIDKGLRTALGELKSARHLERNAQVLILLTDGVQTRTPGEELRAGEEVRGSGVRVYTIGLGANVDEATLRAIAGSGDQYYLAPDSGDLARIYGEIATDLMCPGVDLWGGR